MGTISQAAKNAKQPRGGYVGIKFFEKKILTDQQYLFENENINPILTGLVVDYLSRFMMTNDVNRSFEISLWGAKYAQKLSVAKSILKNIKGLDDESIINACKIVGFDVCYRQGPGFYVPVDTINPNEETIHNIRVMVNRSVHFLHEYGPVQLYGFGVYDLNASKATHGDGDYLTYDTVWDFKVSKNAPTSAHTLQLLLYYLIGKHSKQKEFSRDSVRRIGIFNPRRYEIYTLDVSAIPEETISVIEKEVIGYN